MTTIFQIVDTHGTTFYSQDLTTSVGTIKPGLLVKRDDTGDTVSLAGATGSLPIGLAFGTRDLVYAPLTDTFASGESITVALGHCVALMSADFFASGSLPPEITGLTEIFAADNGLIDWSGTNKVGRILNLKSVTLPTGGTGTSQNTALIEFNFGV